MLEGGCLIEQPEIVVNALSVLQTKLVFLTQLYQWKCSWTY